MMMMTLMMIMIMTVMMADSDIPDACKEGGGDDEPG